MNDAFAIIDAEQQAELATQHIATALQLEIYMRGVKTSNLQQKFKKYSAANPVPPFVCKAQEYADGFIAHFQKDFNERPELTLGVLPYIQSKIWDAKVAQGKVFSGRLHEQYELAKRLREERSRGYEIMGRLEKVARAHGSEAITPAMFVSATYLIGLEHLSLQLARVLGVPAPDKITAAAMLDAVGRALSVNAPAALTLASGEESAE